MNKTIIILLFTITLISACSDKNTRQNGPSGSGFSITRDNPENPWKKVNYFGYYAVTCPVEWKVTRDSSRLFLRPVENKPIGVIIGMETDDSLNRLELGKYFVHFFKNVAVPRNIRLTGLSDINFNGLPALQCNYRYKNTKGIELSGIQITLKNQEKIFFVVTESPEYDNEKYALSMKWVLESIRFTGVSVPNER